MSNTEKSLVTHDIALPSSRTGGRVGFRLLLLSTSDLRPPQDGWSRIERFLHLTGGRDVGIVFLLQETSSSENGIIPYMELQARYVWPNKNTRVSPSM
jgi:hypothetical protein